MSTCNRCGISAWHPEARSCTLSDCHLRVPATLSGGLNPRQATTGFSPPTGRGTAASVHATPAADAGGTLLEDAVAGVGADMFGGHERWAA